MPWIEELKECAHPGRNIVPYRRDEGKVWYCDGCDKSWRVVIVDYGHDVMAGESRYEAVWRSTNAPKRRQPHPEYKS